MRRPLTTFVLLGVFAGPLVLANEVALKNGAIVKFERYRVTEQTLYYVDVNGKEIGVKISEI